MSMRGFNCSRVIPFVFVNYEKNETVLQVLILKIILIYNYKLG